MIRIDKEIGLNNLPMFIKGYSGLIYKVGATSLHDFMFQYYIRRTYFFDGRNYNSGMNMRGRILL